MAKEYIDMFAVVGKLANKRLSGNEHSVLLALLSFVSIKGTIFPSHDKLAELTGLSSRTVRRILIKLKSKKMIDWKTGHTDRANEYVIDASLLVIKSSTKINKTNSNFIVKPLINKTEEKPKDTVKEKIEEFEITPNMFPELPDPNIMWDTQFDEKLLNS